MKGLRGRAWLLAGSLGVLGCAAEGVEDILAYLRHRESGDQAGAALGMFFLIIWFLPGTAAALLLGVVPARATLAEPSHPPDPVQRGFALLFRTGAVFFLGLGGLYWAFELGPSAGMRYEGEIGTLLFYSLYLAALIAFATLLWGCAAVVLRPAGAARSPWFATALLVTALIGGAVVASLLVQTAGRPGAAAPAPALVVQNLLWLGGPSLVQVLAVLRTLWLIRAPAAAPP